MATFLGKRRRTIHDAGKGGREGPSRKLLLTICRPDRAAGQAQPTVSAGSCD